MTVKVKVENGILIPLQEVFFKEGEILNVEIRKINKLIGIPAKDILPELKGMMKIGGDALKDSEEIMGSQVTNREGTIREGKSKKTKTVSGL